MGDEASWVGVLLRMTGRHSDINAGMGALE
jgi:hypothetical protein